MSRTKRLYKLYKASEQVVQGISMTIGRISKAVQTTPTPPNLGGEKNSLEAVKSEMEGRESEKGYCKVRNSLENSGV